MAKASGNQDNQASDTPKLPDFVTLSHVLASVTERTQMIIADFLKKHGLHPQSETKPDPEKLQANFNFSMSDTANLGAAFMELGQKMFANPKQVYDQQVSFVSDTWQLWQNTLRRMMGEEVPAMIEPQKTDKRFADEAWSVNPWFDFVKQYYLLSAKHMGDAIKSVKGFDKKTAHKIDFYTQQYIDALAPTNFLITNPEVLRATLESGGENLLKGLQNLLEDYERGEGKLAISMTDYDAFEVGKNVAVTPGKVVYQNDLMQLIQYTPTTPNVAKRPLLITPPWINKYYILDLSPKNSFVKWAVDQGQTVFLISWVNPTEKHRNVNFEDYMQLGILDALTAIEKAMGEKDCNVIGYCIGGTLLAITLAYMKAKNDTRIASATYFTTMLDFTEPGDLGVFIDEAQISALENSMQAKGYLEGREMATTFNMLRSNDLIWFFVINNYLLGKDPFPFDLLFWNSDSTRLPCQMHSYYLRNMYLNNKLSQKGALKFKGVSIDLSTITTPSFMISTKDDHIAPWKSTYEAIRLMPKAAIKFVLAASGHIAGVVNHPDKNKYCYWEISSDNPRDADDWFAKAKATDGSWWPRWKKWLADYANGQVAARNPGSGNLKPIEDAPGSYVKAKC